jgi:hypothetical protein
MHIVPQIVDAELQPLERKQRSKAAQPRRGRFFLFVSETE